MPFDLERTTHVFEPAPNGGVQRVISDDPADHKQIRLIREHLKAEAKAFARGDFGDPARIHGDAMPGLEELEENYGSIDVTFEPESDGGRITYQVSDPVLVEALHDWFEAQGSDHGAHAEMDTR
ncbi:MAG: aspartate carbamoyltransferase [Actinomycetota bacterium]